jgi:hypothetical protein
LELGDPEVAKQMIAWAEQRLAEPSLNIPRDARRQWADAMANRLGAAPTPEQWVKDPLVARLKPGLAQSLNSDVVRLATEARAKPTEK